jgi:hypothetical protein
MRRDHPVWWNISSNNALTRAVVLPSSNIREYSSGRSVSHWASVKLQAAWILEVSKVVYSFLRDVAVPTPYGSTGPPMGVAAGIIAVGGGPSFWYGANLVFIHFMTRASGTVGSNP